MESNQKDQRQARWFIVSRDCQVRKTVCVAYTIQSAPARQRSSSCTIERFVHPGCDGYNGVSEYGLMIDQREKNSIRKIVINPEWCKGCHICVEVCPRHVLEVDGDVFVRGFHPVRVIRSEDCTVCRQCELLCPDLAILVEEGMG